MDLFISYPTNNDKLINMTINITHADLHLYEDSRLFNLRGNALLEPDFGLL